MSRGTRIVKVGKHWINLTEVLFAELIEYDDHAPELEVHFRGEPDQARVLEKVDPKDFEAAVKAEAEEPRRSWGV